MVDIVMSWNEWGKNPKAFLFAHPNGFGGWLFGVVRFSQIYMNVCICYPRSVQPTA